MSEQLSAGQPSAPKGIADYSFVKFLGEGNHGQLYLATPPSRLGLRAELVAVKLLAAGPTGDALRRMTRELRIFASVRSPYLVTLYDAGQEGSNLYYSMEFFRLGSLASPAKELGRQEVVRAVVHAARAAHALHEGGVAHRGIKPANVLIHDEGAKLSDLGLAQVLSPGQTVTGMGPLDSIEYMDPQIIQGGRASRASDVWALGMTLHRALTGRSMYGDVPDRDPLLALRHVLGTTPAIDPSLDGEVADIIAACTAPSPTDRPRTAEALADRLESLTGVPSAS